MPRIESITGADRFSDVEPRCPVDAREIARRLNVSALIEGSLRQADERVRLTVHLIDATDGGHLWSERYERQLTNPFAVQDELSRLIVDGVEAHLAWLRTRGTARPG